MASAIFIRPCGAAGEVGRSQGVAVSSQQGIDLGLGPGPQMIIGDHGSDLMAFVTPGERHSGSERKAGGKAQGQA